jgi:hypothetical protein
MTNRVDHSNCLHPATMKDRQRCRKVTGEHRVRNAPHTADCIDYAAYRAFNNDMVDVYPSLNASHRGLDLIDADVVDCTCSA